MIKRIIRFSAENKYLVVTAVLVVLALSAWTMKNIPLDALPDLSDTQVIVYSRWDRSPDIIEDQVTYPITTALLGAPKVKAIRGFSDFGFSYVYVIFEDGTDPYWARTRVLEYLSKITQQLPQGVTTELGPDASSVGWVYQYALADRTGQHSSDELRSFQDWNLRYAIQSVPGVAEVATVGGQVRQYQITVNPKRSPRSSYAERVAGGYFLDFVLKREQLARYGLSVDDANMMVMTAVGGDNQSTTVEGRERYGINVRYARDYREDLSALRRVLLPLPGGQGQIPMEEIADIVLAQGPSMIRDENGLLAGYVYVDFDTSKIDVGSYVTEAKKAVATGIQLPTGYNMAWSGQYENMLRVKERLKLIVPLTLVLIFGLLYMNTKSSFKAALVMAAVPFSAVGAVWLLWALGYNSSIAVWVGMIALMGLDAETGVFMLLFLDLSHDEYKARGVLRTRRDLVEAIVHGAVKRVRPKAMTVFAAMLGLLPIMWSIGTGADLMKRIAAPMIGGLVTSFLMELLVYPAVNLLWKKKEVSDEDTITTAIAA